MQDKKMEYEKGLLIDEEFIKEPQSRFYLVDADTKYGKRLFFDNSGGSLRLKACVEKSQLVIKWS